jgi:hypothetical protein
MANGLDIVAVGIEDESSVVVGMVIRAYSRRSIIPAASGDSFGMKPVHDGTVLRREGDMAPVCGTLRRLIQKNALGATP